jgi:hypothetical protein
MRIRPSTSIWAAAILNERKIADAYIVDGLVDL